MAMTETVTRLKDYPKTVEIHDQEHRCTWYFKKEPETPLANHTAVTLSHIDVGGQAMKPLKRYPFSELPDRIESELENNDFKVIG